MCTTKQAIKTALKSSALVLTLGLSTASMADNSVYDTEDKLRDAWIDGKVESALLINRHLNNFTIDTDVTGNKVLLTGTVQTAADKALATQVAANIEGVVDVDNQLVVDRDYEVETQSMSDDDERNWSTWFDDATITGSIKSKFLWNDHVEGLDINVDTYNGVVKLKGEADTSANRNLAEQIAQNTEGVRRVENHLTIEGEAVDMDDDSNNVYKSDNRLRDAWIDGKVESALLVNTHLNNFTIDTEVKNNEVFLTGTVRSEVDKELATEIAKSIEGVKNVENDLVVKRDMEMDDRSDNEGDERSWSTWYNDATTTASVKSKFLWDDNVDGLDINVDTMYGVVTLEGAADTSANRDLAEKIAKNTDGVRKVVNKLKLEK